MDINPINNNLICHCCTTNINVKSCELENCEYPRCSICGKKVFEDSIKCPGCRREIKYQENIINIDTISEEELNRLWTICYPFCCQFNVILSERHDRLLTNIFTTNYYNLFKKIISFPLYIIILLSLFLIFLIFGRFITVLLNIGPIYFWCHNIFIFIVFALLGFIIFISSICLFIFIDFCFNAEIPN